MATESLHRFALSVDGKGLAVDGMPAHVIADFLEATAQAIRKRGTQGGVERLRQALSMFQASIPAGTINVIAIDEAGLTVEGPCPRLS